jgi:hypothetical protein
MSWHRRGSGDIRWIRWTALVAAAAIASTVPVATGAASGAASAAAPSPGCALGPSGAIKHVIYLQFDNTHFTRDNPNVPSDIEQMPALLSFMEANGTVLTKDHTPVIAHTADDLVTSLTGVYGNDHGQPEANSYNYYRPDGTTDTAGSFSYWTDPVDSYTTRNGLGPDHNPNIINSSGVMAPAPWVPFTRAGCNVGDVAIANTELENALPDVPLVFGANSPEAAEARNPSAPTATDFEGLSVHCAYKNSLCAGNSRPVADRLPSEPGTYLGYQAVFGAKYLDAALSPNGPLTNLDGQVITDGNGHVGFPGYNGMQATNALAYTLDMQKHGVPVTYTYLTDLHDNATTGNGMGPGMPVYQSQLKADNIAFAKFFNDLAAAHINQSNTLFVFGTDEGDHFVGSSPSPANCNGVTTPCSYTQLGEVQANLQGLLAVQKGIITPFTVHADSAPFVYLTGQPVATDPKVRTFERALSQVTALDPYLARSVNLTNYLADPVEMNVLHMVTADPARTPTLTMFAKPDFYLTADGTTCRTLNCEAYATDVWNHGDIASDINTSWMGFVGPGVRNLGTDSTTWASETDTRPTILALLGLTDDYTHAGRVLTDIVDPASVPAAVSDPNYEKLARMYTSLESPVGPFALSTLAASTDGLASGSATNDDTYTRTEARIGQFGTRRNDIGYAIIGLLEGAAFHGQSIPASMAAQLVHQGQILLDQAAAFGRGAEPWPPAHGWRRPAP